MTTLQKTVITATLAIVAGVGIYEAARNSQLSNQVQILQQQQAPLVEQLRELQKNIMMRPTNLRHSAMTTSG